MKSTYSVIFHLKREKLKKDGIYPVMGRITVDGTQCQFSCKVDCKPELWETKGGRATGKAEKEKDIIADYANTLEDITTAMNEMVETGLNYFKVESGKMILCESPFRVSSVCEPIISIYGQLAERKGIQLEVNVLQNPVLIGDEKCLRLILGNLVSNAVKFTSEGKVTVDIHYEMSDLTVEVHDEGPDITDADKKRIFEPFAQLSNAAAHDGFCIGLALVDKIVRQMDGNIIIEDNGNKGTLFTVRLTLPLADSATALMQKTKEPMLEAAYSVLIIDNDKSQLAFAQQILQHVGASCDVRTSVGKLIDLMRENYYDVVITDLKMSEMNGFDVLDLLRHSEVGNSKQVPVIVSTLSGLITEEELKNILTLSRVAVSSI
jgi:CheY-like chemotaxis protein